MTTRGFGRIDILSKLNVGECKDENTNGGSSNDTTGN